MTVRVNTVRFGDYTVPQSRHRGRIAVLIEAGGGVGVGWMLLWWLWYWSRPGLP